MDERLTKPIVCYQTWPEPYESKRWMDIGNHLWYLITEKKMVFLYPIRWAMRAMDMIKYKVYKLTSKPKV